MSDDLLIGSDRTIGSIVRWAYECHAGAGSTPPAAMFRLGARISTGNREASHFDYLTEAGWIMGIVERLPTEHIRCHVMALYGYHCTARVRLIDLLTECAKCERQIADAIIADWIGKTARSVTRLASDCGLPRRESERQYHDGQGVLRGWDRLATEMLRVSFEGRGWLSDH